MATIAIRTRCEIRNGELRRELFKYNNNFTSSNAFALWPSASSAEARNCKQLSASFKLRQIGKLRPRGVKSFFVI